MNKKSFVTMLAMASMAAVPAVSEAQTAYNPVTGNYYETQMRSTYAPVSRYSVPQSRDYGTVRDIAMQERVQNALSGYGDITASAKNGRVYLYGTVRDDAARSMALSRAQEIAGVDGVVNELSVAVPTSRRGYIETGRANMAAGRTHLAYATTEPAVTVAQPRMSYPGQYRSAPGAILVTDIDDATLASSVRRQLYPYRYVSASVNDGIAILSGNVALERDKIMAGKLADGVPGVRGVKNDIMVRMFDND